MFSVFVSIEHYIHVCIRCVLRVVSVCMYVYNVYIMCPYVCVSVCMCELLCMYVCVCSRVCSSPSIKCECGCTCSNFIPLNFKQYFNKSTQKQFTRAKVLGTEST